MLQDWKQGLTRQGNNKRTISAESSTLETGRIRGATVSCYMLTHMYMLTQGLALTSTEDVENAGKHLRLGSCDQLEPKHNARSCPLNRGTCTNHRTESIVQNVFKCCTDASLYLVSFHY